LRIPEFYFSLVKKRPRYYNREKLGVGEIHVRLPRSSPFWLSLLLFVPASLYGQATPLIGDAFSKVESCDISQVLPNVTSHVREFVENVNRFTAMEVLERERFNHSGRVSEQARSKSNYVATIQEVKPGVYAVDEYRNSPHGARGFDGDIEANLAASLALIFHPSHIDEFAMTCDGPLEWHGEGVWRIDFQQRLDRPATMSAFRVNGQEFTILLKGSAWIDRENDQILHLEADLLQPMPGAGLTMLHQSVDYAPVKFAQHKTTLWLPQVGEVTAEFRGRRLLEHHTYSDFQLFSVDTSQKIDKPADSSN